METSAIFLENECYNKYGKSGKSFYYSQVASAVRWLSTTTSTELANRLSTNASISSENVSLEAEHLTTASSMAEQESTGNTPEDLQCSIGSETTTSASPMENASSPSSRLPSIPSFSEFINSKKVKDNESKTLQKKSPNRVEKNVEKKMRLL